MGSVLPKKSLGQNFLIDDNIIRKIISAFEIKSDDVILEIGPGTGALTKHLVERCRDVTAVELDSRAIKLLEEKYPRAQYTNFKLIHSDIRTVELKKHFADAISTGKRIKVIGNIPYNISSDIIFLLIEKRACIEKAQLMVQKEVAKRLAASPDSKDYGISTVALNLCGKSNVLFDVSPGSFYPRPKVTSSVIELLFNKRITHSEYFAVMELVKAGFNQRRKQLRNSLKNYINTKTGEKAEEFVFYHNRKKSNFLAKRPENLTYNDFIELYHEIISFR